MNALYLLLLLTVFASASLIFYSIKTGISPMPSSHRAAETVIAETEREAERILAGRPPHHRNGFRTGGILIVEAGSGWGGLALALARRLPACRVAGYELSPLPFLLSRLRARVLGLTNIEFSRADFRKADIPAADIVVCYLYPEGMREIAQLTRPGRSRTGEPLLSAAPPDGDSRHPVIISNTFSLPGQRPDRSIQSGDASLAIVYVYRC